MAESFLPSHPDLEPFVLNNVRLTGKTIGVGAYGSVEEVAVPGAICAAKKIHDFFLNPTKVPNAAIQKASARFVRECQLMSAIRHPHIVQFLGVCFLPSSQLPALVMELLLTNLHDLLDPDIEPPPPRSVPKPFFPLRLKVSILNDVGSGLSYLHYLSPPVIHRDLSARNVLLNSSMVAKIADLGVARILPRMKGEAATMTKGPGAIVYMPPEAMEWVEDVEENDEERDTKSKYGSSIDIFSLGVVAIFTLSQTFPCDLLSPTYRKDGCLLARTEIERREKYMAVIYKQLREGHPLLPMIEGCLDFPEKRPDISRVLDQLEEARAEVKDDLTYMNKLEMIQALHRNNSLEKELTSHVQELEQQVQARTQDNTELVKELRKIEEREIELIQLKDNELAESQKRLMQKVEQLQKCQTEKWILEQQLRENEEEGHDMILIKEKEITEAKVQLFQKEEQLQQSEWALKHLLREREEERTVGAEMDQQLENTKSDKTPEQIQKMETQLAEIESRQSIPTQDWKTIEARLKEKDKELESSHTQDQPEDLKIMLTAQCIKKKAAPCRMSRGSAIADDHCAYFTPEGYASLYQYGYTSKKWAKLPQCPNHYSGLVVMNNELNSVGGYRSNKVMTLQEGAWVEKYPPMKTRREYPAVVTTADNSYLLVIGGNVGGSYWTSTVELFDVNTCKVWYIATNLPQPLTSPSATICGDQVYVIGQKMAFTCSLLGLTTTTPLTLLWKPLPPLPVTYSTPVTLSGQLVLIGGSEKGGSPVNSIHQLIDEEWVEIGTMTCRRERCLVVSPSPDMTLIVGGYDETDTALNIIEECYAV